MIRFLTALLLAALYTLFGCGCDEFQPSSDQQQHDQQERLLKEGSAQTGMPAIKNFRERKLLKEILELRDQASLSTWTYTYAENSGKRIFLCNSIGYGIPYATEYTNPSKIADSYQSGYAILPQADPNGLFSPSSAEGTWIMCKDPKGPDVRPVYVEPRVITSPFPLDDAEPKAIEVPVTTVKAGAVK